MAATAVLFSLGTTATAQLPGAPIIDIDRAHCGDPRPAVAITSCTRIINDKGVPADVRVIALRNRGSLLQAQGDLAGAIDDYTQAIVMRPGEVRINAQLYTNRGAAFASRGDERRAEADYDKAITLDPALSAAHVNRAMIYIGGGQDGKALTDLDEALSTKPEAGAYVTRGVLHERRSEQDLAIADFSAAIGLDPADAIAWRDRGLAYRSRGDNTRARRCAGSPATGPHDG